MRKKKEWMILLLLAILSFGVTAIMNQLDTSDSEIPQKVSRTSAVQAATDWLSSNEKVNLSNYVVTAEQLNDPNMEGYIQLENLKDAFHKIYPQARSTVYWQVTAYQAGTKERYSVDVDAANGKVVGYGIYPGAAQHPSMTLAQAQAAAVQAMQTAGYAKGEYHVVRMIPVTNPSNLPDLLDDQSQPSAPTTSASGVTVPSKSAASGATGPTNSTPTGSGTTKAAAVHPNLHSFYWVTMEDSKWVLKAGKPNLLRYHLLISASSIQPASSAAASGADSIPASTTLTPPYGPSSSVKGFGTSGADPAAHLLPISNQVIAFHKSFAVPQATINLLEHQRKFGQYLTIVYAVGTFLFAVAGFIILFRYNRQKLDFSRGWLFVTISCLLLLISQFNSWPTLLKQLSKIPFGSYLGTVPAGILFFSVIIVGTVLLTGISFYISVVAGAAMTEDLWPGKWLRRNAPGWKERIWHASLRGYLLAVIWMALESIFYAVFSKYFGSWSESDASQSPWNLSVPGLFPMLAWVAGTQEEAVYRLFGISLLKRFFPKNLAIALVIPAMIWALGHSLYPVYPFYTRFIELTLFGILIGVCYLRWGFETVVFAHATYDSILMSISLFDGDWVQKTWGLLFICLPFLIGYYAHFLQGKSPASRGLTG